MVRQKTLTPNKETPLVRFKTTLAILIPFSALLIAACGPQNVPPAPDYPAERVDYWVAIGRCEQPGDGWAGVYWNHPGPSYQGGLGFYRGTWDGYKPEGYPEDAGDATPQQQMVVADIVYDAGGYWGCFTKVGRRP